MKDIIWKNYVWRENQNLDNNEIEKIEKKWKMLFPNRYKNCILQNQGKTPILSDFKIDSKFLKSSSIAVFLHFNHDDKKQYYIDNVYNETKEYYPAGIFPFALDGGGNLVCFDYRKNKKNPKIVFWNHETDTDDQYNILTIASDFESFIDSLCDRDEEIQEKKVENKKRYKKSINYFYLIIIIIAIILIIIFHDNGWVKLLIKNIVRSL
jgi:hypothetical protein